MAKETAKKNWRRNEARMRTFTLITAVVNAIYVILIMYRRGGLPGFADLVAIAFWAGQEYVALNALKTFARPTFGQQGELVDCADVSNPKELGYYSFAQDALWVCWVVQTLCNIHGAFFVFYLPVPATVIYKLWNMVLRPLLVARFGGGGGAAAADDDGSGTAPQNRQERRREEIRRRKGKA